MLSKIDLSMTKRLNFTLEVVLEDVLSDDEDLDDEPIMEVSDEELSDLEVDEDDVDSAVDTIGAQGLTARKYDYTLLSHIHKILEK